MTFRIAHCSDWHIGYSSGSRVNNNGVNLRLLDGMQAISDIVSGIIDEKPDCVVISGDVFHTPFPSPFDVVYAQEQMNRLAEVDIPVYILAGNHDSSDIASDIAASKILDDPDKKIFSFVEPYVRKELDSGLILHLVSHHQFRLQEKTFDSIAPDSNSINIFSTHGSVMDPLTQLVLTTAQSPREIVIPDRLLHEWDYILLGHIHERKHVTDKIYYNGSAIRRGFSDGEGDRGWTLITVNGEGDITTSPRSIRQRPQKDFDIINANNLNATEITDMVIERLKNFDISGDTFDEVSAPILRQKIKNVPPHVMNEIDILAINSWAKQAFSWQLQSTIGNEDVEETGEKSDNVSTSIIDTYREWSVADDIIKDIAEKYLESGLEAWVQED